MTNLFEQLLGRPLFCRYCGKRCEGDFRTEPQPGGFPAASCDKCNREHAEADRLMGVQSVVWDIEGDDDKCLAVIQRAGDVVHVGKSGT